MKAYSIKTMLIGLLFGLSAAAYAGAPLPGDSVYQVGGTWETDTGQSIALASLAGRQQVIALVFTGCSNACPVIIESMKRVEKQIPPARQNQVEFVLVSLTPDTDTPKVLKAFAEKKGLNQHWKLLRGNNALVRTLSNTLNGRYKIAQDGDVAHSNTVTLLNEQGQIVVQASGTLTGIKPISDMLQK